MPIYLPTYICCDRHMARTFMRLSPSLATATTSFPSGVLMKRTRTIGRSDSSTVCVCVGVGRWGSMGVCSLCKGQAARSDPRPVCTHGTNRHKARSNVPEQKAVPPPPPPPPPTLPRPLPPALLLVVSRRAALRGCTYRQREWGWGWGWLERPSISPLHMLKPNHTDHNTHRAACCCCCCCGW